MIYVVFASHNGAATLPRMLDSLAEVKVPAGGVTIVAVNNASRDATGAILEAARRILPLTVLDEPRKGKNTALNTAIEHVAPHLTSSDLIVFTDDDVLPHRCWLSRLAGAARTKSEASVFAGSIRPEWPSQNVEWIAEFSVPTGLAYAETNAKTGPISAEFVWGPNMAVRANVLEAGHRFDDSIGPDGSETYGMGSDTEFAVRVERAGFPAFFVEDAIVRHLIPSEHVEQDWVIRRAYRHGAGIARYRDVFGPRARRVRGVPARLVTMWLLYRLAGTVARRMPPSRWRFQTLFQEQWHRGLLASETRRARSRRSVASS